MRKFLPKLLTLICLLVATMGLSVITAHAATVTGTISGGNEYRYHEDKSPVPGWGNYTSTKLKYFTPSGGGSTVPAYCMEPSVGSASGSLSYSSVSWSSLRADQRYAITLAMAYGYGGAYGFGNIHPDCAQLATQAVIWEFVCDFRDTTYPYTLYDSTCAGLFHYAGDGVAAAYDMIIDRIMSHGTIPSFAVKYQRQLSDANAIELTWDGSQYSASVTDTNGVLSEFRFTCNISGVNITQRGNTLTVTATKAAAAQLNGYISSDYGYSLDVNGDEAVLLEPSNGSNYQACTALTEIPDPVVAYIHFKVKVVEEKGSLTINKTDADTGKALAGVTYRLFDSEGNKIADGTTDANGKVTFDNLKPGSYSYQEISTVDGYQLDETKYDFSLTSENLNVKVTRENKPVKGSLTVRKVDVTGSPLAGAELLLETSTDGQTWTEVSKITTDKTGVAKWDDLKIGAQYRVTEVKAPAGYTLMAEPLFTGVLDNTNPDVTITACNAGFVLPFTGGDGFIAPIMFAALALMTSVYFCKKSYIKKEKN